jgi:ribosomal-protein-alanine N-acetyltransferase
MAVQIETERLLIRDIQKIDIPMLLKQKIEPIARQGILFEKSDEVYDQNELQAAVAWASYPHQREYYQLFVVLKSDRTFIGTCSLFEVCPDGMAGIGWHYQSKFAGEGYATEAGRELLNIGFDLNRVSMIYADCFEDNIASIRIMEKLGMSPDWSFGTVKKLNGNGENKPVVRHRILRKEWMTQYS